MQYENVFITELFKDYSLFPPLSPMFLFVLHHILRSKLSLYLSLFPSFLSLHPPYHPFKSFFPHILISSFQPVSIWHPIVPSLLTHSLSTYITLFLLPSISFSLFFIPSPIHLYFASSPLVILLFFPFAFLSTSSSNFLLHSSPPSPLSAYRWLRVFRENMSWLFSYPPLLCLGTESTILNTLSLSFPLVQNILSSVLACLICWPSVPQAQKQPLVCSLSLFKPSFNSQPCSFHCLIFSFFLSFPALCHSLKV